jgi:hypothetical protein
MAMAPGFDIWAASTVDNGYNLMYGASLGKLPFFPSSAGKPSSNVDVDTN